MRKVLTRKKVHVKKGDLVEVINGKNKGQSGKVLEVSTREGKIIVEGVNIATKHMKPTQQGVSGSIVKVTSPLYACKVMLVCPSCNKKTRVGHRKDEQGIKKRFCKKCDKLF